MAYFKYFVKSFERCFWYALSIIGSTALLVSSSIAQDLEVKIHSLRSGDVIMLTPESGRYCAIVGNDTLYRFGSDDALKITYINGKFQLKGLMRPLYVETNAFTLMGFELRPEMRVKVNDDHQEVYADDLAFFENGSLINSVEMDHYVSRVLVEEVGSGAHIEYLKVQAILSRTYAVKNLNRHEKDGFDLCNSVHCQVYEGQKTVASNLHLATAETSGIVVVDSGRQPILSAFSANCGGLTANSEDVWFERLGYLRSVKDSFCLDERSATWNHEIPLSDWNAYYSSYTGNDRSVWEGFKVEATRARNIMIDSSMLNLNDLRREFRLRSTFFSMTFHEKTVKLNGLGYGHGVGLCQQGAMKMAEDGYGHREILGAYFTGVRLMDHRSLPSMNALE